MKELKSMIILSFSIVAVVVAVEAAHKVAKKVVAENVPFAHCPQAVGYNFDSYCRKR